MTALPPIFLTGATGCGKSAVAQALSKLLGNVEIVNADAFQVYDGMEILTAAPTQEEKAQCPHHLYSFLSPVQAWDAASHCRKAEDVINELARQGKRAVIVGGSGLYVKFLSHGISPAPPSDAALRAELELLPLEMLVKKLGELDPEGAQKTALQNRRYVIRNLEIVLLGGKPLSYWRSNWNRPAVGPGVTLVRETEDLDARIVHRTEEMFAAGVADEVARLGVLSSTTEKTLGLAQVQAYLRGEMNENECIAAISLATRQYAKRQRTWLRREASWLYPVAVSRDTSPEVTARAVVEYLNL